MPDADAAMKCPRSGIGSTGTTSDRNPSRPTRRPDYWFQFSAVT
jgi:hypothetical protein